MINEQMLSQMESARELLAQLMFNSISSLEADGRPRHQRGITAAPGVAFLGLDWLDSRNSALLNGAGADARRVVQVLLQMP